MNTKNRVLNHFVIQIHTVLFIIYLWLHNSSMFIFNKPFSIRFVRYIQTHTKLLVLLYSQFIYCYEEYTANKQPFTKLSSDCGRPLIHHLVPLGRKIGSCERIPTRTGSGFSTRKSPVPDSDASSPYTVISFPRFNRNPYILTILQFWLL